LGTPPSEEERPGRRSRRREALRPCDLVKATEEFGCPLPESAEVVKLVSVIYHCNHFI